MMCDFLANAGVGVGEGLSISVAAIVAVGTAVAVATRAFRAGEEKERQKTKTRIEPNPLNVAVVAALATKEELGDVEDRLVKELRKLEDNQANERTVARAAISNIHARLDKTAEKPDIARVHDRLDAQSVATAGAVASLAEVKSSVDKLLDIALQRKPTAQR